MSFIGIFCYLSYILKLGVPYEVVNYYSSRFTAYYYDYKLAYLYHGVSGEVRLCGLFNEPGYFGTICALLLCIDQINLKKISNIIICIAGLLTFSIAFIVLIIVNLVLNYINKKWLIVLIIISTIILFFVFPNLEFNNDTINFIFRRLDFSNDGMIVDNRSNALTDKLIIDLFKTNYVFFGHGSGYANLNTLGVLSFKTYLLDFGVIGFSILYGLPLIFALKYSFGNRQIVIFVICFFLSVYQRPHIFNINYFILLFGGVMYMKNLTKIALA